MELKWEIDGNVKGIKLQILKNINIFETIKNNLNRAALQKRHRQNPKYTTKYKKRVNQLNQANQVLNLYLKARTAAPSVRK